MNKSLLILFLSILTYFISVKMQAQPRSTIQEFNLNEYSAPPSQLVYWKEIYNSETIRAGYYHLKVGAKDDQTPHDFDEVYWIEKGKSKIRIGEKDFDIKQGDVVYVQAKQIHYFHEIAETLDILVLFSKGKFDITERIDQINSFEDVAKLRHPSKNVWNDFLKKKSMSFGLYLLPEATGGDETKTHKFDEINFVVTGSAKFTAGNQQIEVKSGSLFVVPKNVPHYFETKIGIDVFIMFETKSTQ